MHGCREGDYTLCSSQYHPELPGLIPPDDLPHGDYWVLLNCLPGQDAWSYIEVTWGFYYTAFLTSDGRMTEEIFDCTPDYCRHWQYGINLTATLSITAHYVEPRPFVHHAGCGAAPDHANP
jgi:hypothetical protein